MPGTTVDSSTGKKEAHFMPPANSTYREGEISLESGDTFKEWQFIYKHNSLELIVLIQYEQNFSLMRVRE